MPERDFSLTKRWFLDQLKQAEKRQRLTTLTRRRRLQAIHKYLYMGFDAADAQHLVDAIDELQSDILVTKDRDFHDRRNELKKNHHIDILHPSETIIKLKEV
jgi:predicted nucleic acid-binding protein